MKKINLLNSILLVICILSFSFKSDIGTETNVGNTLTYGGTSITVERTECSVENSSYGKNMALVAFGPSVSNVSSLCFVEFPVPSPVSGTFITGGHIDSLKANEVILVASGKSFDGKFLKTKRGQKIVVTNTNGKYHASFKDLIMLESGKEIEKKLSGDFGCN